ncbi:hypothetical protein ACTG9Q_25545 [Actinokineospora sp. 24-640]
MMETTQEMSLVPAPREAVTAELIGGRALTWADPAPPEDEGFEPTIVRGRE